MDHLGWQVVANMYQISIHILTTGVQSIGEPKARWSHLVPDARLAAFGTVHIGLPDMWVIHVDETHFDLLVRKDSDLVTEGCVNDMLNTKEEGNVVEEDESNKVEEEKSNQNDLGPGYMGWS